MAIRFDKDLNREIRRAVDSYNKRLKRAKENNFKYLPSKQSITQIKDEFKGQSATRRELRNRLRELQRFNLKSAGQTVTLDSGEKTSRYNLRQAILRRNRTRRAIDKKIREQETIVANMKSEQYLGKKSRLKTLQNIKSKLSKPIKSRDEIRGISSEFNREFSPARLDTFYDNYFDIIDKQVEFAGYDKKKYDYIKSRLKSIKPDSLIKIINNESHFKMVLVNYKQKGKYNAQDAENIEAIYDYLYDNIDEIIAYYNDDYEIL